MAQNNQNNPFTQYDFDPDQHHPRRAIPPWVWIVIALVAVLCSVSGAIYRTQKERYDETARHEAMTVTAAYQEEAITLEAMHETANTTATADSVQATRTQSARLEQTRVSEIALATDIANGTATADAIQATSTKMAQVERATSAPTRESRNEDSFGLAADYAYEIEEYTLALTYYNQALDLEQNAVYLTGRGDVHLQLGNYQKALEDYLAAFSTTEEEDNLALILANIAHAYYHLNQDEKAIQYAEFSIQADPEWGVGYYVQGLTAAKEHNYETAIQFYNEGERRSLGSRNAALLYHRGWASQQIGLYGDAIQDYEHVEAEELKWLHPTLKAQLYHNQAKIYHNIMIRDDFST